MAPLARAPTVRASTAPKFREDPAEKYGRWNLDGFDATVRPYQEDRYAPDTGDNVVVDDMNFGEFSYWAPCELSLAIEVMLSNTNRC